VPVPLVANRVIEATIVIGRDMFAVDELNRRVCGDRWLELLE